MAQAAPAVPVAAFGLFTPQAACSSTGPAEGDSLALRRVYDLAGGIYESMPAVMGPLLSQILLVGEAIVSLGGPHAMPHTSGSCAWAGSHRGSTDDGAGGKCVAKLKNSTCEPVASLEPSERRDDSRWSNARVYGGSAWLDFLANAELTN